MAPVRRTLLAALLGAGALVTALILSRVLATVFFAITIAYVLVPLDRLLRRRGLPSWWAAAVSTLAAFLGAAALLLPVGAVVYLRRGQLIDLVGTLPQRVVLSAGGFTYVVDAGEVTAMASAYVTRLAISIARSAPVVAAKATVFGFVVFALLLRREQVRRAVLAALPGRYHDIAEALHERVRDTLYALYVIQAVTALGTFLVALVVFSALGYPYPITLAVIAGILQFLPIVGPSLVVIGLAAYEASVGAYERATLVVLLGLSFVAFLPDALLRPRLARETARLPSSLYFVGFAGGVLSLGPVGIIAGPLVIAVLIEVLALLAGEMTTAAVREFES